MQSKIKEKELAIKLRKQGKTYAEILTQVPVAKSTVSIWLRNVGLSKRQKHIITKKRRAAQIKGGEVKRNQRIKTTEQILTQAIIDVGSISDRELWLIGVALYWAEGAKEKSYNNKATPVDFGNTDLQMIRVYLTWLKRCCGVVTSELRFSLYIHESSRARIGEVIRYWQDGLKDITRADIAYIYYKKHNSQTKRLKRGAKEGYYGTLRIVVKSSTNLNRKIRGWSMGICKGL